MATATMQDRVREQVEPVAIPRPVPAQSTDRSTYRCECGHELRVFGGGRHRVYFEPDDASFIAPVMTRVCPHCQRGLPGKNAPSV